MQFITDQSFGDAICNSESAVAVGASIPFMGEKVVSPLFTC